MPQIVWTQRKNKSTNPNLPPSNYPIADMIQAIKQIDYEERTANAAITDLMVRHGQDPKSRKHPGQLSGPFRARLAKLVKAGDPETIRLMKQAGFNIADGNATPPTPPVSPAVAPFTPAQPLMDIAKQSADEMTEQELVEPPSTLMNSDWNRPRHKSPSSPNPAGRTASAPAGKPPRRSLRRIVGKAAGRVLFRQKPCPSPRAGKGRLLTGREPATQQTYSLGGVMAPNR